MVTNAEKVILDKVDKKSGQLSIDDYTKYLSEYPDDPAAYNNRGRNKFNLEDYKGAIEDLNKAVELCPEKVLYLKNEM